MPKGYVVARIDVADPERYKDYAAAAAAAVKLYGGRFLARGGRHQAVEGQARMRNVIIEFESFEAASRYYHSAEYQDAIGRRTPISSGELVLVEGVD